MIHQVERRTYGCVFCGHKRGRINDRPINALHSTECDSYSDGAYSKNIANCIEAIATKLVKEEGWPEDAAILEAEHKYNPKGKS